MLINRSISFTVLFGLAAIVGCGDEIEVVPAEGTVTLNGKPLDKLMIEFWPESEGPRSFAETDADGHFVLTTIDGETKGAVVGTHRVIVKDISIYGSKFMGRAGENVNMSEGKKPRISNNFSTPETSKLSVVVEASGENKFDIEVTK